MDEESHAVQAALGRFVGQWLGVHVPERIDRPILSNTAPHPGPASCFDAQIADLHEGKPMGAVADMFLANWFPASLREAG